MYLAFKFTQTNLCTKIPVYYFSIVKHVRARFLPDDLFFQYQETMKQLSAAQSINLAANQAQPQPPLPKEDTARPPPLPPPATASTAHQQFNMPPPHQNDLPLFPSKESATTSALPSASVTNYLSSNQQPPPPLPAASQPQQLPPLPPEVENRRERPPGVGQAEKRDSNVSVIGDGGGGSGETTGSSSAKRLKLDQDDEELTEAEKTFDAQFKQWEEQFNKWKQQNANHPDKVIYTGICLFSHGAQDSFRLCPTNSNSPNFATVPLSVVYRYW